MVAQIVVPTFADCDERFRRRGDGVGEAEIARFVERGIWHETIDVEELYPAALLVGSAAQNR